MNATALGLPLGNGGRDCVCPLHPVPTADPRVRVRWRSGGNTAAAPRPTAVLGWCRGGPGSTGSRGVSLLASAEPLGSDSWRCLSGDGSMTGVFSQTQWCRERCNTLHTDAVQTQLNNLAAGLPQSSSGKAERGCSWLPCPGSHGTLRPWTLSCCRAATPAWGAGPSDPPG